MLNVMNVLARVLPKAQAKACVLHAEELDRLQQTRDLLV